MYAASNISRCQTLRVIDIETGRLDDAEALLTIARGCPLFQGFRVHISDDCEELTGDQFSKLLQALPHVELLSLDLMLKMIGPHLQDIVKF